MRGVYAKARDLYYEGDFDAALPLLQEACSIYDNYADLHNMLGVILSLKSRYKEAIIHFHKALEINEYYNEAKLNLAITYSNIGLSTDAEMELSEIEKLQISKEWVHRANPPLQSQNHRGHHLNHFIFPLNPQKAHMNPPLHFTRKTKGLRQTKQGSSPDRPPTQHFCFSYYLFALSTLDTLRYQLSNQLDYSTRTGRLAVAAPS